jgi:hypothetical protein
MPNARSRRSRHLVCGGAPLVLMRRAVQFSTLLAQVLYSSQLLFQMEGLMKPFVSFPGAWLSDYFRVHTEVRHTGRHLFTFLTVSSSRMDINPIVIVIKWHRFHI